MTAKWSLASKSMAFAGAAFILAAFARSVASGVWEAGVGAVAGGLCLFAAALWRDHRSDDDDRA